MKFYAEVELNGQGPLSEERFDLLADALYDLDDTDPEISDVDLGAALTEGRATVTMTVEAADPAAAAVKALSTVRTAVHAIGDFTPGWEEARSVLRVAPSDATDRLFTSA